MRLFAPLYERALQWARHQHAPRYLAALSFAESSFFPVPPDVMLAPMALAQPQRAWALAWLTTWTSVAGGLLGYLIGWLAFAGLEPWLRASSHWPAYEQAVAWFGQWGVLAVFIAGFSPIPYKVFTIAAGTLAMPLLPFAAASLVGRGTRFFSGRGPHALGWRTDGSAAAPAHRPHRLGHRSVGGHRRAGVRAALTRTPTSSVPHRRCATSDPYPRGNGVEEGKQGQASAQYRQRPTERNTHHNDQHASSPWRLSKCPPNRRFPKKTRTMPPPHAVAPHDHHQ
jgi:membrane protein YqaA with SNARE-associated domain